VARLSDEDQALLSGYYKRHSMDITNRGKTIGDAIDDQRRWLENEPKR